jgi:hypothetical protein
MTLFSHSNTTKAFQNHYTHIQPLYSAHRNHNKSKPQHTRPRTGLTRVPAIDPLFHPSSQLSFNANMCYILLSSCASCPFPLLTRHTRCSHAEVHGFDPLACPNRMKRRRQSNAGLCGRCGHRKGSLSCFPGNALRENEEVAKSKVARLKRGRRNKRAAIKVCMQQRV